MARPARLAAKVYDSWDERTDPCPLLHQAKRIGIQRSSLLLEIMRQKLRFISCHIDVRGAFRLASLARETKLQRFLNVFVFPAAADHLALEHLKKDVSAPPSAVFFFQRHHITRAHRAAITLTSGSKSDAAKRVLRTRATVAR